MGESDNLAGTFEECVGGLAKYLNYAFPRVLRIVDGPLAQIIPRDKEGRLGIGFLFMVVSQWFARLVAGVYAMEKRVVLRIQPTYPVEHP